MEHPFLKDRRSLLYYSLIWILITGIHFIVLILTSQSSIWSLAFDSLIFNALYFLICFSLWFIVRFTKSGKQNVITIFINHLTTATVVTCIWLGGGYLMMEILYPNNTIYHEFLKTSIPWRIIISGFYYLITVLIYYIIIYYNDLQETLNTENKLRELVKQTELDVLKAQINPHFLFNSLNSISSLTITDPVKAQEMIIKLSDFLRYSVSQPADQFTNLKNEIDNSCRYLDIEQVRFGKRLVYTIEVAGNSLNASIPALILQPLYENAIKHGVYESTEPINIQTHCELKDKMLEITITNNFDPDAKSRKGAGIGLKNTRERMKLIYKNEQLLKFSSEKDQFMVTLFIPQE
jgi:two-component system, LytTR family, sensor kinase